MNTLALVWLAFASLASFMLLSLMRRKQAVLHSLLAENITEQREWLKKKTRASNMLKRAASRKAAEEDAFIASQKAVLNHAEQALQTSEPAAAEPLST